MHVYTKDMHVREIPVVKSGGGGGVEAKGKHVQPRDIAWRTPGPKDKTSQLKWQMGSY